jgi:hypothetical protein
MSNHFHILLEVPRRPPKELLPSDAELVERLRQAQCSYGASTLARGPGTGNLLSERFRAGSAKPAARLRAEQSCGSWLQEPLEIEAGERQSRA